MGFDPITGTALTQKFQDQFLHEHYLIHKIDEVVKIEKENDRFTIKRKEGNEIIAKAVIIATGMKKKKAWDQGGR